MDRDLSTLELTALGIIWKKGPCTAYAVMREFAGSQTMAYRSGAGSIYPLLKRLRAALMLEEKEGKLAITPLGSELLRDWAQVGDPKQDIYSTLDPVRSRVYFLGVLSPAEQRVFIENSLKGLNSLRREAKEKVQAYKQAGQEFSALAMRGVVFETEARIKFIKNLQRALEKE